MRVSYTYQKIETNVMNILIPPLHKLHNLQNQHASRNEKKRQHDISPS